jgi:hypothetical protein
MELLIRHNSLKSMPEQDVQHQLSYLSIPMNHAARGWTLAVKEKRGKSATCLPEAHVVAVLGFLVFGS